jgi:hypothetical protein
MCIDGIIAILAFSFFGWCLAQLWLVKKSNIRNEVKCSFDTFQKLGMEDDVYASISGCSDGMAAAQGILFL